MSKPNQTDLSPSEPASTGELPAWHLDLPAPDRPDEQLIQAFSRYIDARLDRDGLDRDARRTSRGLGPAYRHTLHDGSES